MNGCFRLKLYSPSGGRLEINIGGYDPKQSSLNFVFSDEYVDPPTYGSYTQHVGNSNGYNIESPQRYAHNPDATWEDLQTMTFDLQDWASRLPTELSNYSGYVGMLG